MGQELRSIVLTEEEFTAAAGLYFNGRKDSPITAKDIGAVEGPGEPNGTGRLTLKTPLVDGKTTLTLQPSELVEMVVAFCHDRAIPLPRNGRKTILRRDEQIVLEIEMDWF